MKNKKLTNRMATIFIMVVCATIAWNISGICDAQTQPPPANLPAGVEDVVKLTRAGMSEDIILTKVRQNGVPYNLTTDQIIYLSNQGVSQNVLSALLQGNSADQKSPPANPSMPSPVPTTLPAPVETAAPPTPSAVPQENLVQEYDDYIFGLKECKIEDREDKQVNDGQPHKQLVCKVLVTNQRGDRNLRMAETKDGEHTRVVDNVGAEFDCSGGRLGTSEINFPNAAGLWGRDAELNLPSEVPIKAELGFGARNGIGYFPAKPVRLVSLTSSLSAETRVRNSTSNSRTSLFRLSRLRQCQLLLPFLYRRRCQCRWSGPCPRRLSLKFLPCQRCRHWPISRLNSRPTAIG